MAAVAAAGEAQAQPHATGRATGGRSTARSKSGSGVREAEGPAAENEAAGGQPLGAGCQVPRVFWRVPPLVARLWPALIFGEGPLVGWVSTTCCSLTDEEVEVLAAFATG